MSKAKKSKPGSLILKAVLMATVLLIGGCRTQKEASGPSYFSDNKNWERLSVPIKVRMEKPQSFSIGGTAIFERDKSISVSFKMIGFEVAGIYMDTETFLFVDKYHKKYIQAPIREISKELNLSLSDIQDLLLGRVPNYNFKKKGKGKFSADLTEKNGMIEKLTISIPDRGPFTIDYGSTYQTPYGGITKEISSEGKIGTTPFSAEIELSPNKAKWNDDVSPRSFSPGKNYTEIPLGNLKKMFSSMMSL